MSPREKPDDFLGRWSRRKQEARRSEPEELAAPVPGARPDQGRPDDVRPDDMRPDEEVLEELGLPDPDTLGPGADFRAFMAEAVPDRIRRRALRRLWGSNPVLANLDRLVDYGEDYTDAATVVANLQTAYRAGRGYLDRLGETAETPAEEAPASAGEAAEQPEPSASPADAGGDESEAAETGPESDVSTAASATSGTAPSDTGSAPGAAVAYAAEAEVEPAAGVERPHRRMRFDFDKG